MDIAGLVNIKKLEMTSHKGDKLDITPYFYTIEVFEDILSATISARVYLLDAVDLMHRFPIIGQERVSIHFETPTLETIRCEFTTFEIPVKETRGNNVAGYFLELITEDGFVGRTKFLSKAFQGNSGDVVRSIVKDEIGSTRDMDFAEMGNTITFIAPRQRPFEAINTICNRSFTTMATETPDVLFYDTVDGYRMKSLYALAAEPVVATYTIQDSANHRDEEKFFNVGNYSMQAPSSILSKIGGGALGGTLGVFDIVSRQYTEKKINVTKTPEKYLSMNNELDVAKDDRLLETVDDSTFRFVLKGSKDQTLLERTIRLDQVFGGNRIIADLNGNSNLRVGHCVDLFVPHANPEDTGKTDKVFGGKYMVASLRHVITKAEINSYRTVVELVKDSTKRKI